MKIVFFLIISTCFAKEKVIYKYKQYEKFDLGDLQIKGELIAPGDLTVKQRNNKFFYNDLYTRKKYKKVMINEIKFLR
ncbi:MAG: hypothetical protein N4A33_05480 [Bacteriovoracaceae bacterium]|jgi:hypothetical protein|nr:hypothetical protein [Bacteriovoracaceae bacterium]